MSRPVSDAQDVLVSTPSGYFSDDELNGLPLPVMRFFRSSIVPGSPLVESVSIRMVGRIRIGRWLPFRARETLSPLSGFRWEGRVGGLITGHDQFIGGRGELSWRLAGVIPVVGADGPDVSRSAAQRAAAEAVWLPTVLLPRFGVKWKALDSGAIRAKYPAAKGEVELEMALNSRGLAQSVVLDRWGDPDNTGEYGEHRFGGEFTEHGVFGGLTIPTAGRMGWHFGTDRWTQGEFFRFRITSLEPLLGPS